MADEAPTEEKLQEIVYKELVALRNRGIRAVPLKLKSADIPWLAAAAVAAMKAEDKWTPSQRLLQMLDSEIKKLRSAHGSFLVRFLQITFGLDPKSKGCDPIQCRKEAKKFAQTDDPRFSPQDLKNFSRSARGYETVRIGYLAEQIVASYPDACRNLHPAALTATDHAVPVQASSPDDSGRMAALPESRFAGRSIELESLTEFFSSSGSGPRIAVISGAPGLGKTALAGYWVQRNRPSDQAPITIEMRGFTDSPANPIDALFALAVQLNVNVPNTGGDEGRASALFRSLLGRTGTVVVIDDVRDEAQVRALLPTTGAYDVVVTSRSPLHGLDVSMMSGKILPLPLSTMGSDDSLQLFRRATTDDLDGDCAELVRLLSGYPLAIRIAATLVSTHMMTVAELTRELRNARSKLNSLDLPDKTISLPHLLSTSLSQLKPEEQQYAKCLGLLTRPEADTYVLAALSGGTLSQAQKAARCLESVGLIEIFGNKCLAHDLVHEFLREAISEDPSAIRAACSRLLDGYYGCVNYAFNRRNPDNPMIDHAYLNSWMQADGGGVRAIDRHRSPQQWFAAERPNIVGLTMRACDDPVLQPHGARLAFAMFYLLEASGRWDEWEAVTRAGLRAANESADLNSQALLHRNIGRIELVRARDKLDRLSDVAGYEDAFTADVMGSCERALESFALSVQLLERSRGSDAVRATIQREKADTYLQLARLDRRPHAATDAINSYLEAEDLYRSTPSPENPIASLSVSLGDAYRMDGDFPNSSARFDQALKYAVRSGPEGESEVIHPRLYAYATFRYANLLAETGDISDAISNATAAIAAFAADDNLLSLARAQVFLADMQEATDGDAAARSYQEAVDTFLRAGSAELSIAEAKLDRLLASPEPRGRS